MGRVCPCSRSRAKQIACVSLHVVVAGLFHVSQILTKNLPRGLFSLTELVALVSVLLGLKDNRMS